ncbi:MAG: hypothetical protein GEV04_14100 [Actinophytocola sp.]|nr:hypothetical protein [Actinophytocola sp.]
MEQCPLVMGVVAGPGGVAPAVRDGADILDLGRASGAFVREVRHTNPGVPLAVDVAGGTPDLADLLYDTDGSTERDLAALAAESGAAVVCSAGTAERMRAPAQVFISPGWRQDVGTLRRGRELAEDWPVLLTVSHGDSGPDAIAAAALAATAGVRIVRTDRVTETRRTVDMIASIAGTRQPARVRRALA